MIHESAWGAAGLAPLQPVVRSLRQWRSRPAVRPRNGPSKSVATVVHRVRGTQPERAGKVEAQATPAVVPEATAVVASTQPAPAESAPIQPAPMQVVQTAPFVIWRAVANAKVGRYVPAVPRQSVFAVPGPRAASKVLGAIVKGRWWLRQEIALHPWTLTVMAFATTLLARRACVFRASRKPAMCIQDKMAKGHVRRASESA